MHSITPILRRIAGRGTALRDDAPGLDADEAQALWGAVLDDAVADLELGALLASLTPAVVAPDEMLGLHRALAARSTRLSPGNLRRAIAIPAYGLVPGEAAFAVLLALFLRRLEVPVLLHGPLDAPSGPSVAVLLRELGVKPSATVADAERELHDEGIAFVPVQLLSSAFAEVIALRTRLGTASVAHVAALAIDPGATGAVRLAMCVPGTPTARLAPFLAATEGEALLLSWPPGASPANFELRPRISLLSGGLETVMFESEVAGRASHAADTTGPGRMKWIREVLERRAPAPLPLVNLAAACLHATGAAADFTQAKAIVALQAGRLAA